MWIPKGGSPPPAKAGVTGTPAPANAAKAKQPKGPPPAYLLAARKGFDGTWHKEHLPNQNFSIKGEKVIWPNGQEYRFTRNCIAKCELEMHDGTATVTYSGKFVSDGRIVWDNGSAWVRSEKQDAPVAPAVPLTTAQALLGPSAGSVPSGGLVTIKGIRPVAPTLQQALERVWQLDGHWQKMGTTSKYRVEGTKIYWLDSGKIYTIGPRGSPGTFVANIEGNEFVATLSGPNKLVWNNGGTWIREADVSQPGTSSTAPASAAGAAASGSSPQKAPEPPSKPTVVHGPGGVELGSKIDNLLSQMGAGTPVAAATAPAPVASPAATSTASSAQAGWTGLATQAAHQAAQQAQDHRSLVAAVQQAQITAMQQGQVQITAAGYAQAQVAAAMQQGQAQVTAAFMNVQAQRAAAIQQQQLAAMYQAQGGKFEQPATAQAAMAARASATAANYGAVASKPVAQPGPPGSPGPPLPAGSASSSASAPTPAKSDAAKSSTKAANANVPSAASAEGGSSNWSMDWRGGKTPVDVLKTLASNSQSALALKKLKDEEEARKSALAGLEARRKEEEDARKKKELEVTEKRKKLEEEAKARAAKLVLKKMKSSSGNSSNSSKSRGRGRKKPKNTASRSRDKARSRGRGRGRSPKRSSKVKRRRQSSSSKSAGKSTKRNRGRQSNQAKKKKRKSESCSPPPAGKDPKIRTPFVPRELRDVLTPAKENAPGGGSSPKVASPASKATGAPQSKSAAKPPARCSEASAAAAAELLERLARSGKDNFVAEDDSDDGRPMKGRWAAEVSDEEADAQDTSKRLAALGSLSSEVLATKSEEDDDEALAPLLLSPVLSNEDDEDDDMQDNGPLPEVSELRARAMAITGSHAARNSNQEARAGGSVKVNQADHRQDQEGAVEEAVRRIEAKAQPHVEEERRVRVTSGRGQAVNLMAVCGFCAKFGEVVAMHLEGSGSEASAVIEFRNASEAQACFRQRESESLKVALFTD